MLLEKASGLNLKAASAGDASGKAAPLHQLQDDFNRSAT